MAIAEPALTVTIERLTERITVLEGLVARLIAQPVIDYGALENTPEECQAHTCSYYRHYLAYGPADLEHEGYHQAERQCDHWQTKREEWDKAHDGDGKENPTIDRMCETWEQRVRA